VRSGVNGTPTFCLLDQRPQRAQRENLERSVEVPHHETAPLAEQFVDVQLLRP
jgi:hypothetical protein